MKGIIGKKLGMTQIYNEAGERVSVTVIAVEPNTVVGVRSMDRDGYHALQLGYGQRKAKNVSKAVRGHVAAAGLADTPPALIREIRLDAAPEQTVGDKVTVEQFAVGDFVDISSRTRGRGFQGVVKRWRFGGGRASHGGGWTRRPGSIGMCVSPGKIYKNRKMPGHMGDAQRTVQNLRVVGIRTDDSVLLVKGSVPGAPGGIVTVRSACKK